MVWLTLLAWGLRKQLKEDLLAEETMANPGGQDGPANGLDQTFNFGETVAVGQEAVKLAQGRAAAAEKRAAEAEGNVDTLVKVRVENSCFKMKCLI